MVFDPPGGSFRSEIYPEYKAHRDATPEDIILSVPLIKQVLEALKIPYRMEMGYEADDLIGFLAKKAEIEGFDVYMMTPDKDFGQLVDKVRMYRPGRGRNPAEIWGPEEVCAKFGLNRTDQVIDYLGLMGDASDNIPGVPGVGAKTAAKLLCEFDSIDGLYENTDKLNGKMREKVEANHDLAILSRKLATMKELMGKSVAILDKKNDIDILEDLEFRTLLNKLVSTPTIAHAVVAAPAEPKEEPASESGGQLDMFNISTPDPTPTPSPEVPKEAVYQNIKVNDKYHLIGNDSELDNLISQLIKAKGWGFHTITDGFNPMKDKLLGLAFSLGSGDASYVHLSNFTNDALGKLKPVLEDCSKEITATNYKFAIKVLAMHGIKLSPNIFDCMVAHYLLDPDQTHKLQDLAKIFLGYDAISLEGLVGKGKNRKTLGEIDIRILQHYACEAADLVLQLKNKVYC